MNEALLTIKSRDVHAAEQYRTAHPRTFEELLRHAISWWRRPDDIATQLVGAAARTVKWSLAWLLGDAAGPVKGALNKGAADSLYRELYALKDKIITMVVAKVRCSEPDAAAAFQNAMCRLVPVGMERGFAHVEQNFLSFLYQVSHNEAISAYRSSNRALNAYPKGERAWLVKKSRAGSGTADLAHETSSAVADIRHESEPAEEFEHLSLGDFLFDLAHALDAAVAAGDVSRQQADTFVLDLRGDKPRDIHTAQGIAKATARKRVEDARKRCAPIFKRVLEVRLSGNEGDPK